MSTLTFCRKYDNKRNYQHEIVIFLNFSLTYQGLHLYFDQVVQEEQLFPNFQIVNQMLKIKWFNVTFLSKLNNSIEPLEPPPTDPLHITMLKFAKGHL